MSESSDPLSHPCPYCRASTDSPYKGSPRRAQYHPQLRKLAEKRRGPNGLFLAEIEGVAGKTIPCSCPLCRSDHSADRLGARHCFAVGEDYEVLT